MDHCTAFNGVEGKGMHLLGRLRVLVCWPVSLAVNGDSTYSSIYILACGRDEIYIIPILHGIPTHERDSHDCCKRANSAQLASIRRTHIKHLTHIILLILCINASDRKRCE